MRIRPERPQDAAAIALVVKRAFDGHPRSTGAEPRIVARLRASSGLSVSLITEVGGWVCGYVASSPVQVGGRLSAWHGIGPVAVDPEMQGKGVGTLLIEECLARLRRHGAAGCVVFGSPALYRRFGFKSGTGLTYAGGLPDNFMALPFGTSVPRGEVTYHGAFDDEA